MLVELSELSTMISSFLTFENVITSASEGLCPGWLMSGWAFAWEGLCPEGVLTAHP